LHLKITLQKSVTRALAAVVVGKNRRKKTITTTEVVLLALGHKKIHTEIHAHDGEV